VGNIVQYRQNSGNCVDSKTLEGVIMELIDILNDDALAERVALDCHDPTHDSRWCGTCETRSAAIDNYQQAVLAEYNKQQNEHVNPDGTHDYKTGVPLPQGM
jgi:hypothetical protein